MEKIWLKNYPPNVPTEINPDRYSSILEIFQESSEKYSNAPAYHNLGVTITFKQLDEYSLAFATYLQQILQLKKGDRVAIMLPNILQYPIVMFGILRAGLTVVNVNPLYTPPELIHQLKDSGAETIIVVTNFAHTVEKALAETSLKNIIVTSVGDLLPWPKAFLIDFYLKYIRKKIRAWNIPHAIKFNQTLTQGKKLKFLPVTINPKDIAFLQYTGGTTGISKGAMLTHRNIISNILQAEAWFGGYFSYGKEIIITAIPLYHIFSLLANCLFMLRAGSLSVLIADARDVSKMVDEMSKFKFTAITGVNTLYNALLNNSKFARLDFSSLKLSLGGGAAVLKPVADRWQKMTGVVLLEAYGLTETSPFVTGNPVTLKEFNGTIGMPVPSTDILILNDKNEEAPIGSPGELTVKGPQVMLGYWNNPRETTKVMLKEGWLRTGDIVSINEEGYVTLLDRKKDMILVSGFNVYPNEIEDVLMHMPGVAEAAAISVPDEHSGEAVKVFIVKRDPNLTVEDVLQFCRQNLTGYKRPKYVEFRSELPKSNVGKILRRALRETS